MATITITVPDAQVPRVRAAFGALLDKPTNDVTLADVQGFLAGKLRQYVRNAEREAAGRAAADAVTDIEAT